MKDQFAEQLSALLDGELNTHEQDRTVSRLLGGDKAAMDKFGRYQLIGDVVRGESAVLADEISASVSAALAQEPTVLAPPKAAWRWAKPAAGLAVAASVAVAAVVVAPGFMQSPGVPDSTPAVVTAQPEKPIQLVAASSVASPGGPQTLAPPGQWQTLDAELSGRLNRLVIEHHEFGGRTGIKGPVAHIGLVNYAGR
jgi:sigma-E factor negative regulatory protein RseA